MPIVDGRYVAPTWINKSVPAINASELNAISGTLAKLDISNILVGTYDGTGVSGSANPNTITFTGNPGKLRGIYILGYWVSNVLYGGLLWIRTSATPPQLEPVSVFPSVIQANVTFADDSVSWYSSGGALEQLNASNYTYRYIAFFGDVNV